MKNIRYHHCPQMKIYDSIGYQWIQNLMFMNSPNFRSEVCNTDIYGLRFNSKLKFNPGNSIFNQVNPIWNDNNNYLSNIEFKPTYLTSKFKF